jgi:hypothetical protein
MKVSVTAMNQQLFFFAAKAGSLEGYLYKREKLDNLDDWVNNIVGTYHDLPLQIRHDIKDNLSVVLNRILAYGTDTLDARLKAQIRDLLAETGRQA